MSSAPTHPMIYEGRLCAIFASMAALLVAGAGCGKPKLPDLPAPNLQTFSAPVQQAIGQARQTAIKNPDNAGAVGKYCMVLHSHQLMDAAVQCYTRASGLAPESFEWTYLLGLAQASAGRTEPARRALQKAWDLRRDYVPAALHYARVLLEAGDIQKSREVSGLIAQQHPRQAAAHYAFARALAAASDLPAALRSLEQACRIYPDYAAAHYTAAQIYRKSGDEKSAQRHTALYGRSRNSPAPEHDPVSGAMLALNATAQPHIQRSLQLEALGHLDEAAAANELALRIDPSAVRAHVNLISVFGRLGRVDSAVEHYRKAILLQPSHADAHYNYGVLLFSKQRYGEAEDAFQRALRGNPEHADARNNYGYVLELKGNRKEALRQYLAAIEVAPRHRLAHYHAARLLSEAGRSVESVEHLQQILEPEDDSTPGFLYALATVYARSGRESSALPHLRHALRLAEMYGQQELIARLRRDLQALEGSIGQ